MPRGSSRCSHGSPSAAIRPPGSRPPEHWEKPGPPAAPEALESLRELIDGDDSQGRLAAAVALLDLGQADEAIPPLVAALGSETTPSPFRPARSSGRIRPRSKEVVSGAGRGTFGKQPQLRMQVLSILPRDGTLPPEALPALIPLLTDGDASAFDRLR